jgi:hypothetical protein
MTVALFLFDRRFFRLLDRLLYRFGTVAMPVPMAVSMPVATRFSGFIDRRVVRAGIRFCRIRTHHHFRIRLGVVAGRLRVSVIAVVGCFLHRMTCVAGFAGFAEVARDLESEEAEASENQGTVGDVGKSFEGLAGTPDLEDPEHHSEGRHLAELHTDIEGKYPGDQTFVP